MYKSNTAVFRIYLEKNNWRISQKISVLFGVDDDYDFHCYAFRRGFLVITAASLGQLKSRGMDIWLCAKLAQEVSPCHDLLSAAMQPIYLYSSVTGVNSGSIKICRKYQLFCLFSNHFIFSMFCFILLKTIIFSLSFPLNIFSYGSDMFVFLLRFWQTYI